MYCFLPFVWTKRTKLQVWKHPWRRMVYMALKKDWSDSAALGSTHAIDSQEAKTCSLVLDELRATLCILHMSLSNCTETHLPYHLCSFYSKGQKMDEKKHNMDYWVLLSLNRACTQCCLNVCLNTGFFSTYGQRKHSHLSKDAKIFTSAKVFFHNMFPSAAL